LYGLVAILLLGAVLTALTIKPWQKLMDNGKLIMDN